MKIIPAIDLIKGKITRLLKGDFNSAVFYKNTPEKQAMIFEGYGFKNLHVVDLIGSKAGMPEELETLRKIKGVSKIELQYGGGVRNLESAASIFGAGADKIITGTLSVKNKKVFETMIDSFGADKFIVAADFHDERISVEGWTESQSLTVYDHIEYCLSVGIDTFICTDISRDGAFKGANFTFYNNLQNDFQGVKFIISGGVKDIEDIKIASESGFHGIIIGKAIYENKIDLGELVKYVD